MPYMWGLLGIIYNTTMVDEAPPQLEHSCSTRSTAGQILMFNNSRDAIGVALKYLGYSYNTTDEAQIKEAVDLLIQQKPLVQSYVMDEIFEKMQGGSAAIGAYYYGDYLTMAEVNPDLAFCLPKEGTNLYVDAMCIPKGAENKEPTPRPSSTSCAPPPWAWPTWRRPGTPLPCCPSGRSLPEAPPTPPKRICPLTPWPCTTLSGPG